MQIDCEDSNGTPNFVQFLLLYSIDKMVGICFIFFSSSDFLANVSSRFDGCTKVVPSVFLAVLIMCFFGLRSFVF